MDNKGEGAPEFLARAIKTWLPGFDLARDGGKSFDAIGIKSFELLAVRAALEARLGNEIADGQWLALKNPAGIIALLEARPAAAAQGLARAGGGAVRLYDLGMPQLSMGGLSESWLLKECGDLHWRLLEEGLGTPSRKMCDGMGERLYATFTRLSWKASPSLAGFRENDQAVLTGQLSRLGAGMFFGEYRFSAAQGDVKLASATSFSRRASPNSNRELTAGQPPIPQSCPIPVLAKMPDFGLEYQARRRAEPGPALYSCDYGISPPHDINGVGLLYFAAYPVIVDICEARHLPDAASWLPQVRVTARDVFYFANCEWNDRLTYRLHASRQGGRETEASLLRQSDGALMAYIITAKEMANG